MLVLVYMALFVLRFLVPEKDFLQKGGLGVVTLGVFVI